jgi:xanthine dehydrogenase molybdenum-binding subunit
MACPTNGTSQRSTIAELDRMTVHASTQVPYYVLLMLSQILGMDMSRIRVVKQHVGGGFACRTETLNIELIAALLLFSCFASFRIRFVLLEPKLSWHG